MLRTIPLIYNHNFIANDQMTKQHTNTANETQPSCLIELSKVSIKLGSKQVLSNLDLQLYQNEIVTVIGPNGAGKSTLVKTVLGLIKPDGGTLFRQPAISIGYVPQKLHLDQTLPLNVQRFLSISGRSLKPEDIKAALSHTRAEHLLASSIHELSGGEFQRVLLARALLKKPDLLVLDEPVQGVDMNGQSDLYRLISDIRDQTGCAILMVSHDLHFVMASTDRVICLNQHICCSGHPETVSADPAYLEIFGNAQESLALYTHHHDHHHSDSGHIVSDSETSSPNKQESP